MKKQTYIPKTPKKQFCWFNGDLMRDLLLSVEVDGLEDIIEIVTNAQPDVSDICINPEPEVDHLLPESWGESIYVVYGQYHDCTYAVGLCNFKK